MVWSLIVVAIAVLSSVTTAAVMWVFARRHAERALADAGDELAAKVRRAVEEGADAAKDRIREAVRDGVENAVSNLLPVVRGEVAAGVGEGAERVTPQLRAEVRDGVEEAIASAVTGGVVERAGEELVRKGGAVLNRILGDPDER